MSVKVQKIIGAGAALAVVAGIFLADGVARGNVQALRDGHGARLACVEQVLDVGASHGTGKVSESDLARRVGIVEGLLGIESDTGSKQWDGRIGRVYGAAKRLGHDVEPCLSGEEA